MKELGEYSERKLHERDRAHDTLDARRAERLTLALLSRYLCEEEWTRLQVHMAYCPDCIMWHSV